MISRAAYLDRGLTPHLLAISGRGLRAKYMKPIFPVSALLSSALVTWTDLVIDVDFPVSCVHVLNISLLANLLFIRNHWSLM